MKEETWPQELMHLQSPPIREDRYTVLREAVSEALARHFAEGPDGGNPITAIDAPVPLDRYGRVLLGEWRLGRYEESWNMRMTELPLNVYLVVCLTKTAVDVYFELRATRAQLVGFNKTQAVDVINVVCARIAEVLGQSYIPFPEGSFTVGRASNEMLG